ncbi:MAG: hypothetical protein NZ914_00020 [Gemmatales bacterium]|nr:hypothetical protein [Gemmatales bacterium]
MAAQVLTVACPQCKTRFQAPASLMGKKVKCKKCGGVVTVVQAREEEEWTKNPNPYGVTQEKYDVVRCPFCAKELESEDQKICLNCGFNLQTRQRIETKVLEPVTSIDWTLWLLPGIASALGMMLCLLLILCLLLAKPDLSDYGLGWLQFKQGHNEAIPIYASVGLGFLAFFAGRFAFLRLVLNPRPPEAPKRKKREGGD